MALSNILNDLSGARDALVTAINEKGGSLDATAWMCKKNEEEHEKTLERRRCQ